MELYVDLHIHSALSPCAEDEMTPCNIVNMAYLKGLDAIAITDHNIGRNVEPAFQFAKERGIILVPGMEIQTQEEFHSLCLFEDIESFHEFRLLVEEKIPSINNKPEIFGRQLIFDNEDEVIGEFDKLLINSVAISFDEVLTHVTRLGGVVIPAHVDRSSYSIINSLGFIPDYDNINTIEVYNEEKYNELKSPLTTKAFNIIKSSDAHRLGDIQERVFKIEVEDSSLKGIIDSLKGI